MLNIISGVITETSGSLYLDGEDITRMPEHERARVISRVFQDPTLGACPCLTVRENLSMALNKGDLTNLKYCLRHKTEKLKEILMDISLDLQKIMDVKVKYLSGGQKQALSLMMQVSQIPNYCCWMNILHPLTLKHLRKSWSLPKGLSEKKTLQL